MALYRNCMYNVSNTKA